MPDPGPRPNDPGAALPHPVALRARDWGRRGLVEICDVLEPWQFGTVTRSTRYPTFYDFNAVQVQRAPDCGADELIAFADQALSGLAHRRIDFELYDAAAALRPEFEARGWKTFSLLRMRYEGGPQDAGDLDVGVETVPYDAVEELRVAWHEEELPGIAAGEHLGHAREVSQVRGVQVLGIRRHGVIPIAFAEVEHAGDGAEISSVYVRAEDRGRGLGTALTRAAIAAAPVVRDLWITADDEDRPKRLYARLGFRPVWRAMHFLRLPGDPR